MGARSKQLGPSSLARQLVVVLALFTSTGCFAIRSYYGAPATPRLTNADVRTTDERSPVSVSFQFQTNGRWNPKVTEEYYPFVLEVLRSSKQFSKVSTEAPEGGASLQIEINNVANIGRAVALGLVSGLTWGLIGTKTTDTYECTVIYQPAGGEPVAKNYRTQLVSTSGLIHGSVDRVEGVESKSSASGAFQEMLEQLILHVLADLPSGKLPEASADL